MWDVASGKLLRSVTLTGDTVFGVSLSPDGTRVAAGCTDNTVRIVDTATGKELHKMGAHENWVLGTVFGADGKRIVSVGRDRAAKLTDTATGGFLENVNLLRGELSAVARHPSKEIVVIGGDERVPYVYLMDRPKIMKIADDTTLVRKLERQNGAIAALAWSPDGTADRGRRRGARGQHLRCRDRHARGGRARDTPREFTRSHSPDSSESRPAGSMARCGSTTRRPGEDEEGVHARAAGEVRNEALCARCSRCRASRIGRCAGNHRTEAARRGDRPPVHSDRHRAQSRRRRARDSSTLPASFTPVTHAADSRHDGDAGTFGVVPGGAEGGRRAGRVSRCASKRRPVFRTFCSSRSARFPK